MTITLDPPATRLDAPEDRGVHALTTDPAAPDRRISFAALWARADAGDAVVHDGEARQARTRDVAPVRKQAAPGRIGGVQVVPAVLDRPALTPPAAEATATSPAGSARASARKWFVDEPDGLLDDADPAAQEGVSRPPARLLVSPEFERRRAAVEAEIRRRARQPLLWVLLVGVIALLGLLALFSPLLSVRHVDVVGVDETTAATIRAAAGPLMGTPTFRVDPVTIVRRLEATVDVAAVRVEKHWPNRVVISPAMRRPMAVLRAKGAADRVIDESGAVMSERAGVGLSLPVIAVDATDALHRSTAVEVRQLREAAQVVRAIGPTLRARLGRVDRYGDEYVLRFGKATVRMGRATDLPAKTAALNALSAAGQLDHANVIDVSVPDTAIVTASAPGTTKASKDSRR